VQFFLRPNKQHRLYLDGTASKAELAHKVRHKFPTGWRGPQNSTFDEEAQRPSLDRNSKQPYTRRAPWTRILPRAEGQRA
jgi:hypothetical protein